MVCAMFAAMSDQAMPTRVAKLLLRGPVHIKDRVRTFLELHEEKVDQLMSGEPATPASETEVRTFVEPFLKRGIESATFARMADIYLFSKELTPESILFAFYILIRFAIAGERQPTLIETKLIWEFAEGLAQTSKIGAPQWKELESQGERALTNWLKPLKASARKKYETFLIRKKRLDASAEVVFQSLISMLFTDAEKTS